MKYNNFKKYILFIIISFVTVIGKAYAIEEDQKINTEFNGSPVTISAERYINLSCRADGELRALTLDRKANGDYTIQYNKLPDSDGTDKIYCEWTGENSVGFENYASNITYIFNYQVQNLDQITITLNGSLNVEIPTADVVNRMENFLGFNSVYVTRVDWLEGNEFLNTSSCPSDGDCVVSASDQALNRHETLEAKADVFYTSNGAPEEKKVTVTFLISFTGGLKLYPGGIGTCNFDSSTWNLTSIGGYQYYESSITGTITLPTCTPNNIVRDGSRADRTSDLLEFAGWVRMPEARDAETPAIGACAGAITGNISATSGGSYSACYNYKSGIQLVIDSSSSLDPMGTCRETDTGVYFCEGTGNITLPNVVQNDTVVGRNRRFVGWASSTGGELKNAGDPVSSTEYGTYYAKYETTTTEVDRYKIVYVGQSSFLSVSGMTSCSASSNPNLDVRMQTNDCLVKGLQPTGSGEFIDVTVGVTNADGSEKVVVYKFQVKNAGGNSEASNGSFVIDVDARIEAGQNDDYALNDFEHKMCETATVRPKANAEGVYEYTDINSSKNLNSNNYEAKCEGSDKKYFALCMDPGRNGPNGDVYTLTERVNQDSDVGHMIGAIIKLINKKTTIADFDNRNNSVRVAAHVAIRTVVLMNGYSGVVDHSDEAYYSHYKHYEKLAKDLTDIYNNYTLPDGRVPKSGDETYNAFHDAIAAAVDGSGGFGIDDNTAARYLIDLFVEYKNFEYEEGGSFQRTIDSRDTVITGDNSYEITYKGTFTLPFDTRLSLSSSHRSNYDYFSKTGVKGTLVSLTKNDELSKTNQEVYDYVVKITVSDVEHVVVPKNHKEELEYSLKLTYNGGIDFSSVRIANPLANSAAKQRMVVFDLGNGEANIYFDINAPSGSVCGEFDSLDYTKCPDEDHCDINQSLFKASGCCREILDESTYSYLVNNVCNGECTVSTMSNVCSYDPDYTGTIDLYEVKEGAHFTGADRNYKDAIGTCIVNVKGNYAFDYKEGIIAHNHDNYSSYGTATTNEESDLYQKYDERGNSIMVASYRDNRYCQVSCREDWTFTMGAFGNFVGKNAVLAGKFFQNHDNDIFISGGRTCYTTYLDYDIFMNDLVDLSEELVNNYNQYANWSHAYSDIKRQVDASSHEKLEWHASSRSDGTSCLTQTENQTGSDTDGDLIDDTWEYNGTWSCAADSANESYGYYTLDLDHQYEFAADGVGAGNYKGYQVTKGNNVDNEKYGVIPTEIVGLGSAGTSYSQDTAGSDECTWESTVDGHTKTWTASGDHCYAKDTHESDEFTRLSNEMKEESSGNTDTYYAGMSGALGEIINRYEQFWNCQHFELYNGTDEANGKTINPTSYAKFMGATKAFVQIMTMFEPYVSYTYDESVYMTILHDDNILIQYDDLNDAFFKKAGQPNDYSHSTNVQVDATVGFSDRCHLSVTGEEECEETDPIDVKLSRNKLSFSYYDPADGPWVNSQLVKTYGIDASGHDTAFLTLDNASATTSTDGEHTSALDSYITTKDITLCTIGTSGSGSVTVTDAKDGMPRLIGTSSRDAEWHGGECHTYPVSYVKAHYIKTSMDNSSFYRNKGIWYTGPNDTREHGETLEDAWDNAEKRGREPYTNRSQEEKDKWSVFVGSKEEDGVIKGNLNIFPVSMTTARNLYQYTYEFSKIGTYTDGRLGRIMGDAASIISQNARTCFYEIIENICVCCGDPIVAHTNVSVPSPQEFVESTGYPYEFNRETDGNSKGVVGFSTTTVATSDLNGSTNRVLASNWTNKGVFYYGSNKLETNKGAVALEEIQSLGENVYLNDSSGNGPEYSFELKPSTIAAIRDYNDMYGYTVNFDNLKLYGRASIQPLGSCSDPNHCTWFTGSGSEEIEEMNNKIANFGHYGSVFLENFDDIVGTTGAANIHNLSNLTDASAVCELVRKDNASSAASDLKRLIDTRECRWIDYIETSNSVLNMWDETPKIEYYRLAFK